MEELENDFGSHKQFKLQYQKPGLETAPKTDFYIISVYPILPASSAHHISKIQIASVYNLNYIQFY